MVVSLQIIYTFHLIASQREEKKIFWCGLKKIPVKGLV
jgi:hypothetical protein